MKKFSCFLFLNGILILLLLTGCSKSSPGSSKILPPTISNLSPTSGVAGTAITITGTNFGTTPSENTVKINGVDAIVSSASAVSLTITAPAAGTTGKVIVITDEGTATGPVFTYTVSQPPPTIISIVPTSGPVGTLVTINGTNFKTTLTDNTVKFNSTPAIVQSATATVLTVLAPDAGTTGVVSVTTADGTANGPVFTYTAGTDVYLVGKGTAGLGYWKNGAFTALPSNCVEAWAVFASGPDVYVAGADINTGGPAYWKNGTTVDLPMTAGHNGGRAHAVFVSGTDVYVAGWDFVSGSNSLPRLWKNGIAQTISLSTGSFGGQPITTGLIYSIAVSGSDVYLAGAQTSSTGTEVSSYWKNGAPVTLTTGSLVTEAKGIFVSGSDVYVTAYDGNTGEYWENSTQTLLSTPAAFLPSPTGIYVSGSDVYVSGYYQNTAKYWLNGTMNNLTTTAAAPIGGEFATGIAGSGTDIYICGNDVSKGNGYWKNGVFNLISDATGINGIFVK